MANVELTNSLLGTVGAAIMVNEIAKHCIASKPANRFDTTPYIAPDAWAATTAYALGAYVVANGNIYSCLVAGTSGSTAPSGAGAAAVTDGTAKWIYIMQAFSNDAEAPTVSLSSTAPSATGLVFYRPAGGGPSQFATGFTTISSDKWFMPFGMNGTVSYGMGSSNALDCGGWTFYTDSPFVIIGGIGNAGLNTDVEVDGRFISLQELPNNAGGGNFWKTITFAKRKVRKWTVRYNTANNGNHAGVYIDYTCTCWFTPTINTKLKVLAVTDSFGGGGVNNRKSWIQVAYAKLGFQNLYIDTRGSTGFTTYSGSEYGSAGRLAYITSIMPDIVHVQCSVNDAAGTSPQQAALTSAVNAYIAAIRAIVPNALIIVSGVMGQGTSETTGESTVRLALAALQATDKRLLFIPVSGDGTKFISGAGSPIDIRNDGNCDAYMGADKVHPNTRGHTEYLGARMARKIEAALMAI